MSLLEDFRIVLPPRLTTRQQTLLLTWCDEEGKPGATPTRLEVRAMIGTIPSEQLRATKVELAAVADSDAPRGRDVPIGSVGATADDALSEASTRIDIALVSQAPVEPDELERLLAAFAAWDIEDSTATVQ
jgi:hypothetical protein